MQLATYIGWRFNRTLAQQPPVATRDIPRIYRTKAILFLSLLLSAAPICLT
jgi:hypothetical protein